MKSQRANFPLLSCCWKPETRNRKHAPWSTHPSESEKVLLSSWRTGPWLGWVVSVQSLKRAWITGRSWGDRKEGGALNPCLIWSPLPCPRCPHWQWRPSVKVRLGSWSFREGMEGEPRGTGSAGARPSPEDPWAFPWPSRAEWVLPKQLNNRSALPRVNNSGAEYPEFYFF